MQQLDCAFFDALLDGLACDIAAIALLIRFLRELHQSASSVKPLSA